MQRFVVPSDKFDELKNKGIWQLSGVFHWINPDNKTMIVVNEDSDEEVEAEVSFESMGFGIGDGTLTLSVPS